MMFGITCAPEIFQKSMEQMLIGCLGNTVIIGKDESEHGQNLNKVLKVLAEKNVPLNEGKCQYR